MAPLSVHRPGRGTRTRMPAGRGPLGRPSPAAGSSRRRRRRSGCPRCPGRWRRRAPCGRARRRPPPGSCAATSATSIGTPSRCWVSTQRATAVLRPENEKSKRCRSRSRRLVSPRGKSMATWPLARGAVDVRAARERQAEQPRHLVERLARRVVDGRAERLDRRRSRPRPAAGWSGRR